MQEALQGEKVCTYRIKYLWPLPDDKYTMKTFYLENLLTHSANIWQPNICYLVEIIAMK